jgi:hypothetical protein
VLVISRANGDGADPLSIEGAFHRLLGAYRNDRREVVWWTPDGRRAVALEYLRRHRSRYDCIVELASNGRRFWTPFYSLKPILMIASQPTKARWPYLDAELLRGVPEDAEALEVAIRRAMTRRDAYFMQDRDGTWRFHPRRPVLSNGAAESAHPAAAASVAPASVQ